MKDNNSKRKAELMKQRVNNFEGDHLLKACLIPAYSFVDIDKIMPVCSAAFDTFQPLSCDILSSIINKLNKTTSVLDPFSTNY